VKKVSESLENYLRVIYEVQSQKDFARVKDITSGLNVKTASVADALKKLGKKGLVEHKKYGYIKLTQEGIYYALNVYQKHQSVLRFLTEALFMEENEDTEELACGLEHHLNKELFGKIEELSIFFRFNPDIKERFREFLSKKDGGGDNTDRRGLTLADTQNGEQVKVLKLNGDKNQKSRLISTGILPGMTIRVNSNEKEIIKVRVRGFSISLEKREAEQILVDKPQDNASL